MEYGLIGLKLSHSFSPEIHKSFKKYEYELKEISAIKLGKFFKKKDFKGLNVTIPYKQAVMPYLDEISETALKIGAVNTIVNKNGRLFGDNTDLFGVIYTLEKSKISVKDKTVAVLGSGGASKTVVYALKHLGAKKIFVVSRQGRTNYNSIKKHKEVEIMINASPVGMYPNNGECLVHLTDYPKLEGVVDLIYNPEITEFLAQAKNLGIKHINGLYMLVAQAFKACEIFTDEKLDQSIIDKTVEMVRKETKNYTFIGMPGCGKTSIGKLVSEKSNREFFDCDLEFEMTYQLTPARYIEIFGEKSFREKENKVVESLCSQSRNVISTGGGAVINTENRKNIKSNSIVVWIKRDLEKLSTEKRPLSKNLEELKKLYATREKYYSEIADIIVENNGDMKSVVEKTYKSIKDYKEQI